MRLAWYAGSSAALAAGVVTYAFNQRANFYSAMVYLSQNNLSLMILINLILLIYGSFVYGLQRLCYGQLRPVEIEQLYEKAWFAVTETCLAMTIFREEVGAWFLVMFTALVTGKVWEWIGEGRVEVLEQQPPANPRLFHTRLSISLLLSIVYDTWLFMYTVNTVIQQARPNMMVMFLFEFAILSTCSMRTGLRYVLSLVETKIVKKQIARRMEERRKEVRDQRLEILRRRSSGDAEEASAANQEELPNEDDIDEMDIEVPGWESKGQWILSLDLGADFMKLCVYAAFFAVLMMFYGLPIHIMRDLFMTTRSFLKRLSALVRYRKALQDMNRYPDATQEELTNADTCIICREEMRRWDPNAPGAVERYRPKKLPCGHILHFGCLKSWLERQQVCPTCRRSVAIDAAAPNGGGAPGNLGDQAAGNNGAANVNQALPGRQLVRRPVGQMRMFQLGPIRLGFAQGNGPEMQELAQRLAIEGVNGVNGVDGAQAAPATQQPQQQQQQPHQATAAAAAPPTANSLGDVHNQLHDIAQRLHQEIQGLQATHAELQTLYALMAELQRLRQLQQQVTTGQNVPGQNLQNAMPQQLFAHAQLPVPLNAMYSPFPYVPPRNNTPSVTRHAAGPHSTAIPAGSPDLPEGLVIPQGWSLMPLQRMEGQPHQYTTQSMGQPVELAENSQQAAQAPSSDIASHHTYEPAPLNGAQAGSQPYAEPSPVTSTAPNEPPSVAAPTPLSPNWAGASQFLANGGAGPSSLDGNQKSGDAPNTKVESEQQEPSSGSSSNNQDKGKSKAVTVEDAEDE